MSRPESDRTAIDRLLDSALFAPLGYVLRRDEVREDLAAAGRKQVAFARSLGRAALKNLNRGAATATSDRSQADSPASSAPTSPSGASEQQPEPLSEPEPQTSVEPESPASPEPFAEAVEGYSDMTAKEVAAFLRTATLAQVRWIVAEESVGKQRVTILRPATALLDSDD